jgi:DNA-binding response OmpR family regulator
MQRSILVVDNKRNVVEVLVKLLAKEGYRVRAAFDGQAALREIEREPPDLVLADVLMPRVDGESLASRLRISGWTRPVVHMSAVHSAVDAPGLPFVPKRFDLDGLLWSISHAFEGHGSA